jgi:hypothetical protein
MCPSTERAKSRSDNRKKFLADIKGPYTIAYGKKIKDEVYIELEIIKIGGEHMERMYEGRCRNIALLYHQIGRSVPVRPRKDGKNPEQVAVQSLDRKKKRKEKENREK